ncbi:hypothetical protein U1Q18_051070 [Sarracenia purpurea var. burkii]
MVDDEGVTAISTKIDGAGRTETTKSIEDQPSADTGKNDRNWIDDAVWNNHLGEDKEIRHVRLHAVHKVLPRETAFVVFIYRRNRNVENFYTSAFVIVSRRFRKSSSIVCCSWPMIRFVTPMWSITAGGIFVARIASRSSLKVSVGRKKGKFRMNVASSPALNSAVIACLRNPSPRAKNRWTNAPYVCVVLSMA